MKLTKLVEQVMMAGFATRSRTPFKATTEETDPMIDENGDYIDESGRVWKGWKPLTRKKK